MLAPLDVVFVGALLLLVIGAWSALSGCHGPVWLEEDGDA